LHRSNGRRKIMTEPTLGPLNEQGQPRTISGQLDALVKEVGSLKTAAVDLKKRTRRNEMGLLGIIFTIAVDLALSALVLTVYWREENTRQFVLCPLYNLIGDSYNPRSGDLHPKGRAWYDNAFGTLELARESLNCKETVQP
jgi:hypothetical protein